MSNVIDMEWLALIHEAKRQGLTQREIKDFFYFKLNEERKAIERLLKSTDNYPDIKHFYVVLEEIKRKLKEFE